MNLGTKPPTAFPTGNPESPWIDGKIDLALEAIHSGEPANAFEIYAGMFRRLQDRWL